MKTLKKVGSIAAGAALLGAAVSGAVSAGLDDTGLTEDFFYDMGYNPVVQIVVGEKGMATDSVAAGNIAAVIGNLAYIRTTAAAEAASGGAVVLGVSARGATGKFEQATYHSLTDIATDLDTDGDADFYIDDNVGLIFSTQGGTFGTDPETYTPGEFISYSLACDQQERTEAGILKKGTYNNIHCLFCETLCLTSLENPEHEMEESIVVDLSKVAYLESGLGKGDPEFLAAGVLKNGLKYQVDAGEIPMSTIYKGSGLTREEVDFEWRGRFIMFGEEYYVKDISGTNKVYLAKGRILDDISSEGYTSEYMGYKFKIDHLIYSEEYRVAGILLDVEKPDGSVVQTQISRMANGIVDDIEISGVYAEEADAVATASIIVYDTATNALLEDGKDIEVGGEVKKYWRIRMETITLPDATIETSEYADTDMTGTLLNNVTVYLRHRTGTIDGLSIDFPATYKLIFGGFRTNDYNPSPCSGAGEGDIVVERDEKYRGLISFTGDDGQRYNGVYMDQGPLAEGDMFVLNGNVYEYDDSGELSTEPSTMRVTLKDLLNGGKQTYPLSAVTSSSFHMYTYAFEESTQNDDDILIEPDSNENDSDVYLGAGPNQYLLYDGGDLYLVRNMTTPSGTLSVGGLSGMTIGIDQYIFSGSSGTSSLNKFELDDARFYVKVLNENGSFDVNSDRTGDGTDRLITLENADTEYLIVDFYDRDFNDSADTYYSENVLATGETPAKDTSNNYQYRWQDPEDVIAYLPEGGTKATIEYGGNREIESVNVCQPQDIVYATVFIGTSEQATTIDSVITADDEGLEKTIGCCTYLVKEFGVTTSGVMDAAHMNPLIGNLVVAEIAADTTKNLIVVGGPSVNSLCALSKDEIQAASGQYIVRKDGSKLYIAGWTAADTIDAGNTLTAWLQDNTHT